MAKFGPFLGPRLQIGGTLTSKIGSNWSIEFQNWFNLVSWDVLGLDPPWIHTDPAISDRQTPKTWLFPVFGPIWAVFDRFWALEVPKFQNEA